MAKGTNAWHGSLFTQFQDGAMNGSPTADSRYDPSSAGCPVGNAGCPTNYTADPTYENYQPIRPHTSDFFPGFTVGGPLFGIFPKTAAGPLKDRVFLFAAFNPEFSAYEEKLNYGPSNGGNIPFSQNTQTYYSYARIDSEVTNKIRVFGSWLYQLQRGAGENLPGYNVQNTNFPSPDSTQGYFNLATGCYGAATTASNCLYGGIPPAAFAHNLGYVAPNITLNTGADITITNSLVATSRFGYYFENYHDSNFPTTGTIDAFQDDGLSNSDLNGNSLQGTSLYEPTGYFNMAQSAAYTHRDASKAIQFDQDIAWFHSGWWGTHNFKFGYQMNRDSNDIYQRYNTPYIQVWPGTSNPYSAAGSQGATNCAALARIMREGLKSESHLCYKHVVRQCLWHQERLSLA
jgi:hypothetical protein